VVAVAASPRRRTWYSTRELAARWCRPESKVRLLLEPLEARGYVVRRGDCWRASERAIALHLADRDGQPL
jgi:DNA-binding IclR family transcriptional regulator